MLESKWYFGMMKGEDIVSNFGDVWVKYLKNQERERKDVKERGRVSRRDEKGWQVSFLF